MALPCSSLSLSFQHFLSPVYCRSGARAGRVVSLLKNKAGFVGATIYNGQGVSQWRRAGYSLVNTPSNEPPCMEATVDINNNPSTVRYCARSGGSDMSDNDNNDTPADDNTSDTPSNSLPQKKDAPEPKCGSLAKDMGGQGAADKDCSSRRVRRRVRVRGLSNVN
jgi:hypothetical protein